MKKAKKTLRYNLLLVLVISIFLPTLVNAQAASNETAILKLHYFNINNNVQYLLLESSTKKNKVFTPQKNILYKVYLDTVSNSNLISSIKTNDAGKAKMFFPPYLKSHWDKSSTHMFIVMKGDEEVLTDYYITKARLEIDTTTIDEIKNITVKVSKEDNGKLFPVPDVEMKVGIQRLVGVLSGGDEETYTSDSSGVVTVPFTKINMPGDSLGNLILVAKIEDNETLGNITVEKKAKWGVPMVLSEDFFSKRELWSTRFRSPYWLLFMAYAIIIGVYSTLIYLIVQLVKTIKIGKQGPPPLV